MRVEKMAHRSLVMIGANAQICVHFGAHSLILMPTLLYVNGTQLDFVFIFGDSHVTGRVCFAFTHVLVPLFIYSHTTGEAMVTYVLCLPSRWS